MPDMISFEQFLAEGRRPSHKYSEPDVEIAKQHLTTYTNMGAVYAEVRRLYQRFTDQLLEAGVKEKHLKGLDLQGLIGLADDRGIQLKAVFNRGRRELYTPTDDEMAAAKQADPSLTDKEAKAQVKKKRAILIKRLNAADETLLDLEKKNLADLDILAKKLKLDMTAKPKRNINWDKFEKDVCAGINQLFKIGFFKAKKKGKLTPIKDTSTFYAKNIGGGTKSDVQVFHEGKSDFFVECKLNFDAAEYFKFGLTINGDKLQYNHKRFLDGHSDPAEVKEIDELFKKKIDLPAVLNDIVQSSEVKKSWQQFLKNLQEVKQFLQSTKEYKSFASGLKLQSFPTDFKSLTDVFDKYVNYYVTRYNTLLDEIFDMFKGDKELQSSRKQYKIMMKQDGKTVLPSMNGDNGVFVLSNLLISYVDQQYPENVFAQKKEFDRKINMLKMIEAKFEALLHKMNCHGSDYAALNKFKSDEKLMYFFKMFISSAGRKAKGQGLNDLVKLDELGNMQICSSITLKTKKMAEAITNYYVGHGKCAYIQVLDRVYQFDKKINPFGIEKLPIFKDTLDVYNIRISVTDDLSDIRLHVRSIQPDQSVLSKFTDISFIQAAGNYIQKVLKQIVVVLKK